MCFLLKSRETLAKIINGVYQTVDKGKPWPRTYSEKDFKLYPRNRTRGVRGTSLEWTTLKG